MSWTHFPASAGTNTGKAWAELVHAYNERLWAKTWSTSGFLSATGRATAAKIIALQAAIKTLIGGSPIYWYYVGSLTSPFAGTAYQLVTTADVSAGFMSWKNIFKLAFSSSDTDWRNVPSSDDRPTASMLNDIYLVLDLLRYCKLPVTNEDLIYGEDSVPEETPEATCSACLAAMSPGDSIFTGFEVDLETNITAGWYGLAKRGDCATEVQVPNYDAGHQDETDAEIHTVLEAGLAAWFVRKWHNVIDWTVISLQRSIAIQSRGGTASLPSTRAGCRSYGSLLNSFSLTGTKGGPPSSNVSFLWELETDGGGIIGPGESKNYAICLDAEHPPSASGLCALYDGYYVSFWEKIYWGGSLVAGWTFDKMN